MTDEPMDEFMAGMSEAMGSFLAAMPAGPMAGRVAVLIAAAVRASELPREQAMCTLAMMVRDEHQAAGVSIHVAVPVEGQPGQRQVLVFNSDGTSHGCEAVVVGKVGDAPPTAH